MSSAGTFLEGITRRSLPPGVLWTSRFRPDALSRAELPFDLPQDIARAHLKRRAEFAAGRMLCWMALEDIGLTPHLVPRSSARAPIWPPGCAASLSHTDGHVALWISAAEDMALGLDIEPIADAQALAAIRTTVLSDAEIRRVGQHARTLTLAFSAKEAFFKAAFPIVGRVFGFDAVEITHLTEDAIKLKVSRELSTELGRDADFDVRLVDEPPGVMTFVALPLGAKRI